MTYAKNKHIPTIELIKFYFEDNKKEIVAESEIIKYFLTLPKRRGISKDNIKLQLYYLVKQEYIYRYKKKFGGVQKYYSLNKFMPTGLFIKCPIFTTVKW